MSQSISVLSLALFRVMALPVARTYQGAISHSFTVSPVARLDPNVKNQLPATKRSLSRAGTARAVEDQMQPLKTRVPTLQAFTSLME